MSQRTIYRYIDTFKQAGFVVEKILANTYKLEGEPVGAPDFDKLMYFSEDKVQIIAEITPNLPFSEFNFYDLYRSTFEKSELGRIKRLLSLKEMAENFGLIKKSMKPKLVRKAFFTPVGIVALMFYPK